MRFLRPAVTLLLVLVGAAGPALAAQGAPEGVEAGLNWHMTFGGKSVEAGYGVTLGYREAGHFSPVSRLLEFKADGAAATATLAGLPLFGRSYLANQAEADAAYGAGVEAKPWYARSWVLWTAGGIAASALLGAAGSSGEAGHGSGSGCNNSSNCGNTASVNGGVSAVGSDGVGCVGDSCAVHCTDPADPSTCSGFAVTNRATFGYRDQDDQSLDAGTGGMGDL